MEEGNPPTFAELLFLFHAEDDQKAGKTLQMKQNPGSLRQKMATTAQYATIDSEEQGKVAAITSITQHLVQQLADV